jgi:hypothetical protein
MAAMLFNEEQAALIRRMYEAGSGSSTIAARFGTDAKTILLAVRRAGGTVRTMQESARLRPPSSMAVCHTPEAEARAVEAKKAKYSEPTPAQWIAIRKAAAARTGTGKPCNCGQARHGNKCPVYLREKQNERRSA